MKEIEVKAKINDIENLNKKLTDMGCQFCNPLYQEDIIFLPVGIEFSAIVKGTPVVRVRDSSGTITLTLKKRITNNNELIKLEKEIIVNNKQEALEIVEHMNFHEVVRVSKNRTECKHNETTICIDRVADLGDFIEVEKLSGDENSEQIQNELFDFLQTLGMGDLDRVTKGYDTLMYEKNQNKNI